MKTKKPTKSRAKIKPKLARLEARVETKAGPAFDSAYKPPDFRHMALNVSCKDWEERIIARASLMPIGLLEHLDLRRAELASMVFNRLRLPDVPNTPTFEEAGGQWFNEFVRAVFGSWNGIERAINEFFLLVPKKNSKCLTLGTKIATPDGFTTMGQVTVGDFVLDSDGKRTKVTAKSQVFIGKPCYEVEFSTGEKVVCDADHLWVTDAHLDREKQKTRKVDNRSNPCPSVKTTEEIAGSLKVQSGKYVINNHRTALCGALKLPQIKLPMAPYVLGYWLGNGHSAGCRVSMDVADSRHVVEQLAANGYPIAHVRKDARSNNCVASLADVGPGKEVSTFVKQAREIDVLNNKCIPQMYLRGSFEQRLELLRGLMDSDGSISVKGQATFNTTLETLRDGVVQLVNSLGMKATCSEHRAMLYGVDHGPYWAIHFWPFDTMQVFTLPRKLKRQRKCKAVNSPRSRTRQIVAVRKVKSVPTQCISVDSPTKQYLITNSLIPTHNTTNSAGIMVTALIRAERPRSEFLLIAPTHAVSSIAFSQAVGMIEQDEELMQMCLIQEYIKKITFLPTKCTLQIKSFDPSVLTGTKPAGVLLDELHVIADHHNADRVIGQIRGGLISKEEGFLIIITTQSERAPAGVFKTELMKARMIRDGDVTGVKVLPILYEFPPSIVKDDGWKDVRHWDMVTPNNGRSITVARLQEEYQKAELVGPDEIKRWASQHLNIEIGLMLRSSYWEGAKSWVRSAIKLTLEELLSRAEIVTIGIDGGGLDDMLGLTVCGRCTETGWWLTWSRAWVHAQTVEKYKVNKQIYEDFTKDGDLTIVEAFPQDMDELGEVVKQVVESGKLFKVGLDPSGIGAILDRLVEVGVKNGEKAEDKQIVGISQGWRLNAAIKTTERKLGEGNLKHADQPLMRWCVENARVEPRGNAILITKQASGFTKIDPLMALFNAVELISLNPPAANKQYQMLVIGG